MINYAKKTFWNTVIVFAFSLVAALFAYLLRFILARKLTLTEYGLYFSFVAFVGIFNMFRDLGTSQALVYLAPKFLSGKKFQNLKGLIKKVLKIQIIASLIILVLMIIFADFLVQHYFRYGTAAIFIMFAIAYFLNSLELNFQVLYNAFQNQLLFATQNALRNILIFVFTITGFVLFSGINVPIASQIIVCLGLLAVSSLVFFRKIFPKFFMLKAKVIRTKTLIFFGFLASLYTFGYFMITSTDTLALTYFRTLEEVGVYNAALTIVNLMLYIPFALCTVMLPLSSELWSKNRKDVIRLSIEKLTKYLLILLIPLLITIIIYSKTILWLLFGNNFVYSSSAMIILSIGALFFGIGYLYSTILFGIHGPKYNAYLFISVAIINIVLNIILTPRFGITGAAISTASSYLLIFLVSTILVRKKIKFKFEYTKYIGIIFSGIIFLLSTYYLKSLLVMNIFLEIIIVLFASTLIYVLSLFALRILKKEELKEMTAQIMRK